MEATKIISIIPILLFLLVSPCLASPSESFPERRNEIYDDWGVCRTSAQGNDGFFQVHENGFRPIIVYESFGEYSDVASSIAENIGSKYSDKRKIAEEIFKIVKNLVNYTSDRSQFGYDEFAQNADELARQIVKNNRAAGDCEDYAILLSVMYETVDIRSAIILAPGHAACLVHLPNYEKGNISWSFKGEKGWIWAEATGKNNYLGWTPDKYMGKDLIAYEIENNILQPRSFEGELGEEPIKSMGGTDSESLPFFNVVFLMLIIPIIARAF